MRIAVTGAAGFVGRNLVERLAEDHEVTALDVRVPPGAPRGPVQWRQVDVLDAAAVRANLEGAELVFHLAARITLRKKDADVFRLNTEGVANVAEAALATGVRRMVHCSSVHSFDQTKCNGLLTEHSPRSDDPRIAVYDRSKWAGESRLRRVVDRGLDAVIVNPTGLFGPVDYERPLSRLNAILLDAARGRVPAILAGGFDFVDVRDVCQGIMAAAERGRRGENYLLGGHLSSLEHICKLAAKLGGARGPLFALPRWPAYLILPIAMPVARALHSDVMTPSALAAMGACPYVDSGKARRELGYDPRPTVDSLRDLIAWFREVGLR